MCKQHRTMHSESKNIIHLVSNFSIEQYKHDIFFQFLYLNGCFEKKFAYLSVGHSYFQGFSFVISLKVAKMYFLLCQITLVDFTCIPNFTDIWLSLSDYSGWKIKKEKHSISYAVTQNSLTFRSKNALLH